MYVVDSGVVKQKEYNPRTGMDSLGVVPISRCGGGRVAACVGAWDDCRGAGNWWAHVPTPASLPPTSCPPARHPRAGCRRRSVRGARGAPAPASASASTPKSSSSERCPRRCARMQPCTRDPAHDTGCWGVAPRAVTAALAASTLPLFSSFLALSYAARRRALPSPSHVLPFPRLPSPRADVARDPAHLAGGGRALPQVAAPGH